MGFYVVKDDLPEENKMVEAVQLTHAIIKDRDDKLRKWLTKCIANLYKVTKKHVHNDPVLYAKKMIEDQVFSVMTENQQENKFIFAYYFLKGKKPEVGSSLKEALKTGNLIKMDEFIYEFEVKPGESIQ